ncbi:MAG: rod shape-determining protein RodA [Nitrospirae bacterium]|nr:rod shape-determining protein RodA [Nitrospirota bacterium]
MIEARRVPRVDPVLFGVFLFLLLFGALNVYSASRSYAVSGTPLYVKQLAWCTLSAGAFLIAARVQVQILHSLAYALYALFILLLVVTHFFGFKALGAQRWIAVGGFTFQPSEVMKLLIPLAIARYLHGVKAPRGFGLRDLVVPLLLILLPVLLIFKQPDLGTASQIAIASLTLLLMTDIKRGLLMRALLIAAISGPLGWFILKDYQKQRIITFLNPEKYEMSSGYQVIQSKIAVGSGQLFGKGFAQGTQARLRFLPQRHSDFIYSVIAEEWGFLGSGLVLLLLFILFFKGIRVAYLTNNIFQTYLVVGIIAQFAWQAALNALMVLGLLPVVGMPMPLLSYGGTNLVVMGAIFGILSNIRSETGAQA